jgi:signal peptidase I
MRGRVGIGVAMIAMALVIPIGSNILLYTFVVKAYQLPSAAMEPTMQVGDRVLVNQTGIGGVHVGDIAVFHPPASVDSGSECGEPHPAKQACPKPTPQESNQSFIKRIVAGPGDTLSIRQGHPVVNGVEQANEPFTRPCGGGVACNLPKPITVPLGYYFMMGDNRGESADSRFWGPVPESWIVGVVIARYWPLSGISTF